MKLFGLLAGLLFCALAIAAAPAWASGHAAPDTAQRLQDNYQIIVADPAHWDEADLRALADGASTMPRAFFDALAQPLHVEHRPEECLFGQGRYDPNCPSFSADGRVFYVYEPAPVSPRLLARVMPGLDAPQRRALFFQRALVHLVVAKLDQTYHWSATKRWQKLNGWDGDDPMNQNWRGYSRPIGRRSAHLDLITFAEEYFARPEAVRPGVPPDASVACRMMSASRVLTHFTRRLAPDWRPPAPGSAAAQKLSASPNESAAPGTGCPAFEEWFDRDHITGMELVFVGARADAVESIYGHIVIRATYGSGAQYFRAGDQPIFQFGAVTASNVSTADYIFKGLFGGFSSVLEDNSWRVADRLFARYERRDLRRYPMNLTPVQLQQVMQRIWESQRHIHYSYYFFHQNCASLMLDLLEPALDLPFASLPAFIVMPTDVLDTLASTPNGQGDALIDSNHSRWPSGEARALDAVKQRRKTLDLLSKPAALAPPTAELVAALQRLHPQVEEQDTARRREAYTRLAARASAFLDASQNAPTKDTPSTLNDVHQQLIRYFHLSTIVERYFVEHARFLRRESMLLIAGVGPTSAEDELERLQNINDLPTVEERLLARNALSRQQIQRLAPPTDALFTPKANQLWAAEQQVQATYDVTLGALSDTIQATDGAWNGGEYLQALEAATRRDEEAFNHKSIGPSGRFLVGPHLAAHSHDPFGLNSAPGTPRARVGLSAAFIRDELGEARLRGYSPELESKIFDLNVEVEPSEDWARGIKAQAIIFHYLNLARKEAPFVENWSDRFGWGIDIQIRHDGRRGLLFGSDASTGYLYPFWMRDRGVNHLVLGIFGALRSDLGEAVSRSMIGGQAFLRGQIHLYGNYANLLQLKLQTRHFISLDNTGQFDASGELNTRHALGSVERYPVWLEPFVELEYTSRAYQTQAQRVSDLSAGLRLELSF